MLSAAVDPFNVVEAASDLAPRSQTFGPRQVFAFYYTWFDETSWSGDKLSDLPSQPYVSRERATIGRHIEEAKRAGIDGFLVAWYGPAVENNQTESNLRIILEEAAIRGFKAGVLFETDSPFLHGSGDVTHALAQLLATHAAHPAYLRVEGKPVIFFWRPNQYSVDTWRTMRNQVDAGRNSTWISEGVDTSFLHVFDGHHLYSNTWNPATDLSYTNQKFANLVRQWGNQNGVSKAWVATVMPGYNDVGIRPGHGFVQPRESGAYYRRAWEAAIASQPAWIVINSFNEWPEGTYIEPSQAYGDQFIGLTAEWSNQFRNAPVDDNLGSPVTQVIPSPVSSTTPQIPIDVGDSVRVSVSLLNLRSDPNLQSQILTQLPSNTPLTVLQSEPEWLYVQRNQQTGWVYRSMVQTDPAGQASLVDSAQNPPAQALPARVDKSWTKGDVISVDVVLLNLRSSPSTESEILWQLPRDFAVTVEDPAPDHPEWTQVRVDGTGVSETEPLFGWVYASMVR